MGLIRFFFSKYFWLNLIIALGLVAGIIFYTLSSLESYTHHGEKIQVPDLTGMELDSLPAFLEAHALTDTILDSIYDLKHPKGTVLEQTPKPGSWVKKNRLIYLTVNARGTQLIAIPDGLLDFGIARVANELEGMHFRVGRRTYVEDKCPGCVVGLTYKGKELEAGDKVPKGARIDLEVGMGLKKEPIEIPNLYGLTLREADRKLAALMLAYQVVYYEGKYKSTSDSLSGKVFWMDPAFSGQTKEFVETGDLIKLKVTKIESRIPDPFSPDTTTTPIP